MGIQGYQQAGDEVQFKRAYKKRKKRKKVQFKRNQKLTWFSLALNPTKLVTNIKLDYHLNMKLIITIAGNQA